MKVGDSLGPYRVVSELGAGGMGVVFRARDTKLDREVALKVLPAAVASDPVARERFEREARAVASLSHPNILAIHDAGVDQGIAYIVMELLRGASLASRLESGPLSVRQAEHVATQIARGLAAAHEHGIVHRDLKPDNVFLLDDGQVKILDFGLAKASPISGGSEPTQQATMAATDPGTVMGTVGYMAPEQVRGHAVDARADLFALGVVLYEMLTGRKPFQRDTSAETMTAILKDDPPDPSVVRADLPPALDRIVGHCLAKNPTERFQTARDVAFALEALSGPASSSATARQASGVRPAVSRRSVLGTVGAVLLLALAGIALWPRSQSADATRTSGLPVIVMMDSTHPARVYDPATLKAGGTNADDLTDLLRDQPVELLKETASTSWRREDQVLKANPSIFLVHRSCFYDATLLGDAALDEKYAGLLYPPAADKLEVLLGYIGLANPRTRFIVYSRGSWTSEAGKDDWVVGMTRRFPQLKGRLVAYKVPLDRATFRNAQTAADIKSLVVRELATIQAERQKH